MCNGNETCRSGQCQAGEPLGCDDGEDCTDDACDSASGCTHEPAPAGSACDDSEACTSGDVCDGLGACKGTPGICTVDAGPSQDAGIHLGDAGQIVGSAGGGSPSIDAGMTAAHGGGPSNDDHNGSSDGGKPAGSCGCEVPGARHTAGTWSSGWQLSGLVLGMVLMWRRRRGRAHEVVRAGG
jgi:hypothetical protein